MGLTRLDSKKYASLRKVKSDTGSAISSHNDIISNLHSSVNEYGETEIKQLVQSQKSLSGEEITEIVAAYKAGRTTYQLAEQYGVHKTTISSALKKAGIVPDKRKAQKKMDTEKVIKMYSEYCTAAEIGKEYGVNPNAVIKCLRDNGITIRSRWDYPRYMF